MNLMMESWREWAPGVLGASLNGVYQGLLLTLAVAPIFLLMRRTNAATRHAAGFFTLLLVAALPVAHGVLDALPGRAAAPGMSAFPPPAALTVGEAGEEAATRAALPSHGASVTTPYDALGGAADRRFSAGAPASGGATAGAWTRDLLAPPRNAWLPDVSRSLDRGSVASGEGGETAAALEWSSRLVSKRYTWTREMPAGAALAALGVWGLAAGLRLVQLLWQYLALNFLIRRSRPAPEALAAMAESIRRGMGIRRRIRIRVTPALPSPVATGLSQPSILIPSPLVGRLRPEEWEQIFRHELGHVSRRDDWTNLFMQLVKAIYFFHPAVWWWTRRLAVEREIACDDHVLAKLERPQSYALFLTEFAGRAKDRFAAAAPAAWGNRSQLKERIGMILDQTRNISTRLSRSKTGALAAGAAMMAAAVVAMGPRLALAQSADAEVTFRRDADDTADLNSDGNADAADRPASSSNAVASGGAAEIRSAASPETSVKAKAMIYRSADGKTSTITAKEGRLHISEAEPSSGGKVTIRRGASIGPAAANEKYPRVSATAAMSQSVAPRTEGKARYEEAAGRTEDAKPVIKERNAGEETDPVEERLERLEKLVERLLEQRSPRTSGLPDSKAAPRNTPGLPATTKPVRKEAEIHESIRKEIDLQLSRGAQDVRRAEVEVRRAVEAAKHSAEAARRAVEAEGWQRSNPDVELRWRVGEPGAGLPGLPKKLVREETSYSSGTTSESMTMQRRMLDEQRRMLHEQIKQIENQIQELEKFEGFMRSMIHPKEKAKDKPSPDAGISN